MNWILGALALYYAAAVFAYWRPLLAIRRAPQRPVPPDLPAGAKKPILVAIAPCRGGAGSIPGMVTCLKNQNYPADRHRTIILIDRDGDADPSAQLASAGGAEVYERRDAEIKTKGGALNELLARQLKNEPWDALLILDIDVRLDPEFFNRTAAYLHQDAQVLQCAFRSKKEGEAVVRLNHIGQLLSQLVQSGRAALGLSAILCGSCMVFSRSAVEKLNWQTSTGRRLSDDGELNFRCVLADLPVTYAPDLQVLNDLPENVRAVMLQRRRWFTAYIEAIPYILPLLKKGLTRRVQTLENLFTLVFLPGSSLSFVLAGGLTAILSGMALTGGPGTPWVIIFAGLWGLHALYYIAALRSVEGMLTWAEFKHLPGFLMTRVAALGSGILLGSRRNPGHHSIPFETPADSAEDRLRKHL